MSCWCNIDETAGGGGGGWWWVVSPLTVHVDIVYDTGLELHQWRLLLPAPRPGAPGPGLRVGLDHEWLLTLPPLLLFQQRPLLTKRGGGQQWRETLEMWSSLSPHNEMRCRPSLVRSRKQNRNTKLLQLWIHVICKWSHTENQTITRQSSDASQTKTKVMDAVSHRCCLLHHMKIWSRDLQIATRLLPPPSRLND